MITKVRKVQLLLRPVVAVEARPVLARPLDHGIVQRCQPLPRIAFPGDHLMQPASLRLSVCAWSRHIERMLHRVMNGLVMIKLRKGFSRAAGSKKQHHWQQSAT